MKNEMIDLDSINLSGIEIYSDIYYKIAKDYAVIEDIEYIAEKYDILIKQMDALTEEKEFIDLVEKFKKKNENKTKDEIFDERVEIEKMKALDQLRAITNNPRHKQQLDGIKTIFTVSGDMKKQVKNAIVSDTPNVSIMVNKVIPGQKKIEEE